MIHWTKTGPDSYQGEGEPSSRRYRIRRIPAGWLPEVYRRFEKPMSNNPTDPTPRDPEAEVEGSSDR